MTGHETGDLPPAPVTLRDAFWYWLKLGFISFGGPAGQIALNPATMEVVSGGIREQSERVFQNLQAVLTAAGSDFGKVVKTTVYLVDMADFTAMNEIYSRFFGDHKPARSTVAVAGLPRGVRVEIDLIATA